MPLYLTLPGSFSKHSHPRLTLQSYFTRLTAKSSMYRHSFFIQIKPDERPLEKLLFIQEGKDFFPGDMSNLFPDCVMVRREHQAFRRLPKSGCVVFTVKTTVERLVDISNDERQNLAREIRAWPSDIATYKGRDLWQRTVLRYCEGNRTVFVDDDDEDFGSATGTEMRGFV
jgi:hypothetical protein